MVSNFTLPPCNWGKYNVSARFVLRRTHVVMPQIGTILKSIYLYQNEKALVI